MSRHSHIQFILAASLAGSTSAQTWLDLDASRSRDSFVLSANPLNVTRVGSVIDSTTHMVLGKGYYEILGFPQPTSGPWYIQSRFRIDSYNDSDSWYITRLVGTATWPNLDEGDLPTQGFELRIGGGKYYPQIANDMVSVESQYAAESYFDGKRNGLYSTCLLEIVTATKTGAIGWAESFSTRCVEKGVWHHVAAGWDGKRHQLFLDGQDVLDTNRIIANGMEPRLDSPSDLYIGHRRRAVKDQRTFTGAVQSLRMVSGVLDSTVAGRLYHQAFPEVKGTCAAVPVIDYPLTFQYSFSNEVAHMSLVRSSKCAVGEKADLELHPGDSIDVMAVSLDSSGKVLGVTTVATLNFPLALFAPAKAETLAVRLKARLRRKVGTIAARTVAASDTTWNDNRPVVIAGRSLGVLPQANRRTQAKLQGLTRAVFPETPRLVARDPAGRRIVLEESRRSGDTWDLSELPQGFWIVSGGGAQLRFVRL